ncbi:NADPH-dependent F420 reductase [Sinorhizobium meliloti]|uniref:NADPH-dependent F420 reductase n=1 Tax=Rhizobium meliloti TaxID=382 RepID=UPI00028615A8|nr:NAD(P)-binding domain-containing protein [Sinorhizobium meliloti]ASP77039.1 NADP oxidoreductase [Sinorhizobium meliloti]KKA11610.1 NADP oxidoreductase [Sinorhizobium meliloti]MQW21013.1 NADP oxidoreductase [Sinorhizobium meliloti]QND26771.1 NAD(P)-binding domain-containing protein [Sinorhizobium meliloti]RMI22241.1 NADP oxidoreductase [Sinorhizobium meliloti]
MSIGIIGAGEIGSAFARALARNRIAGTISNSRGPDTLQDLARELTPHIKAGTLEEAADADLVLVAVPWSKLHEALVGLPDRGGRIVIDANNPIEKPLFKPADLNGRLSTEIFARLVPGARVVKAFNHLQPHLVSGDPRAEGGSRVLFYSGDDARSKAEVGALISKLGFAGIDLGPISIGGKLVQFPGGPLPALNLVKFG